MVSEEKDFILRVQEDTADGSSLCTYHSDCESDKSIKSPSSHSTVLLSDSESEAELTCEQGSSPQPFSSPSSPSFSLSRSTSTSPLFVVPKTVLRERSPPTIGFSKENSSHAHRPEPQRSPRLPTKGQASMKEKVLYEDKEDDPASQLPHRGIHDLIERQRREEWLNMPECTLPESPSLQQGSRGQQEKQPYVQLTTPESSQTVGRESRSLEWQETNLHENALPESPSLQQSSRGQQEKQPYVQLTTPESSQTVGRELRSLEWQETNLHENALPESPSLQQSSRGQQEKQPYVQLTTPESSQIPSDSAVFRLGLPAPKTSGQGGQFQN